MLGSGVRAATRSLLTAYLSRALPPVLRVEPDTVVTVETLTQHGGDYVQPFVTGDAGAESVFAWTRERKAVDPRGAGPMNATVFGRDAGEGFGVHLCTGQIYVRGAEPGEVLEVEILDIEPRPCANPLHSGKAFASNVSAWWSYQYDDLLGQQDRRDPDKREMVTIYESDLGSPGVARALYIYRWTPRTEVIDQAHSEQIAPAPSARSKVRARGAPTSAGLRRRLLHNGDELRQTGLFLRCADPEFDDMASISVSPENTSCTAKK
jgi:hypothetical protein